MTFAELIKELIAIGFECNCSDDDIYALEEKNHKERKRVVLENKRYKSWHIRVGIDWLNIKMTLLRKRENGSMEKFGSVRYVERAMLEFGSAERLVDDFIVKIKNMYYL